MSFIQEAFEAALDEIASLKRLLKKHKEQAKVRTIDERAIVKATGYSWFNTHRARIAPLLAGGRPIEIIDEDYSILLDWCEREVSRARYFQQLDVLRDYLIQGRATALSNPVVLAAPSTDTPPNFALLVGDQKMQAILMNRWAECVACIATNAPLAATVMMGGLLEGVLLARVNREPNKAPIYTAKGAARDHAGKTKPLNEWTLQHYIAVSHELGWISVAAMSISEVLRDYRNYVHPHKEYSHGVMLKPDDAVLWWEISKTIVRQVVK